MRRIIRLGLIATLVVLVFLTIVMSPKQKTAFSPSFLDHVARNSPKGKWPCYVDAVQRHWTSEGKVYEAASQVREPRGRTDAVNFAIRALRAECE
jgi:hypothetical protein